MDRRIQYFERMRERLETVKDEHLSLEQEKEKVEKEAPSENGRREYLSRVRSRLNAWAQELNKLEQEIMSTVADEACMARMEELDVKLGEGFEKLRHLTQTVGDGWDVVRDEAEALWAEILETFDEVRDCARGGSQFL